MCASLEGGPLLALDEDLRVAWSSPSPNDRWVGVHVDRATRSIAAGDGQDLWLLRLQEASAVACRGLAVDSGWAFSPAGTLVVAQLVGSRIVVSHVAADASVVAVADWEAIPDTLPAVASFGDVVCVTECGPDDIRLTCLPHAKPMARGTCEELIPLWADQRRLVCADRQGAFATLDTTTMACGRRWASAGMAAGATPPIELGDLVLLRDDGDRLLHVPRRWLGEVEPAQVLLEGKPIAVTSGSALGSERMWLTLAEDVVAARVER